MDASYLTQLTFPSCDGGCLVAPSPSDDILEALIEEPDPLICFSGGTGTTCSTLCSLDLCPGESNLPMLDGCIMEVPGVHSMDDYRPYEYASWNALLPGDQLCMHFGCVQTFFSEGLLTLLVGHLYN